MKLSELANRPVKLNWNRIGRTYRVTATIPDSDPEQESHHLEIYFGMVDSEDEVWSITFSVDEEQGITDNKIEIPVFSAVMQAAKLWLNDANPRWIVATAPVDEPSRVKLYKRMASRLAPRWLDASKDPELWPMEVRALQHKLIATTVLARADVFKQD